MGTLSLQATLRGHGADADAGAGASAVWCVAWSPRGLLASSGSDKAVRVWHLPEASASEPSPAWKCVAQMSGNMFLRTVRAVAWGVDGRSLAAACFDATATVCELMGGKEPSLEAAVSLEGHESEVKSLCYSSSGGLLATASRDRSVWVWEVGLDFDGYECIAVLNGHTEDVKCVRWHPSSEILVSCGFDNVIRVWVEDEDDWFCLEQLTAHDSTVWSMAFDKTGKHLVSVGDGGAVVVWSREDPRGNTIGDHPRYTVVAHLNDVHDGPIFSVDWAGGSNVIATCGDDDCIRVLRRKAAPAGEEPLEDVAKAEDGDEKAKIEGGADKLRTRTDQVWETDATVERAHSGAVICVAWNPVDDTVLASCGDDGLVRIWKYSQQDV